MTQPGFGVGLCLPQLGDGIDAAVVRDVAQAAEDLGFDSLWVQEHLFLPDTPSTGCSGRDGVPVPSPYRSTLSPLELRAAMATCTKRLLLGTSVLMGTVRWTSRCHAAASDAGRAGPGAGSEPLSLWLRTFVQHPNAERPRSFDEVIAEVHEAAATGMRHVIIDANFADAVSGTGGWLDMVERLAPAARV